MSQTMLYLFIAPLFAACLFFALGCAGVISSKTGGHPRTNYWNKIFSGLGYLFLTLQSALIMPYLSGVPLVLTLITGIAFALFGIFLFNWGLKLRKAANNPK
ncbi:MAG: hypothetical protein IT342_05630 [Candidatus Melainabacteria bacterium]|nr:hypothetical protein [Candidatus Melainabacteria bacterium]